ncbi:MAG TPA: MFS transporter [Steroidobacteraceae bacterium]|jgi:PAT family beta-lactamase induction signal transducer AmpG|nr:MFS transporter [Steroidobacteraceae bacterium]
MHMDRVNARRPGWLQALAVYGEPRTLAMLFLGFSSGLPFFPAFQTMTIRLRESGIALPLIGMMAWATIPYSLKFLWAPVVDRMPLPVLTRLLGRRRAWLLLAQVGIAIGLFQLAASEPAAGMRRIVIWDLFLTFFAATQDIAMDAWRIESAPVSMQGAMAAAYQVGYRVALIAGSAGALTLAQAYNWRVSYFGIALLAAVGLVTTFCVQEPEVPASREAAARETRAVEWLEQRAHWPKSLQDAGEWFIGAVVCPFMDFFVRYRGRIAIITLALIGAYRLTDYAEGAMTLPFFHDHGYSNGQIAWVVKIIGLTLSMLGVFIAGLLVARWGLLRSLVLGSVLMMLSSSGFALLATTHTATLLGLGVANGLDNLGIAVQGTVLIAYLSSLTSQKYTATQYALFSSLFALAGKTVEGFSGFVSHSTGYPLFFVYTATLSIPGLLLLFWLWRTVGGAGLQPLAVADAGGNAHAPGS